MNILEFHSKGCGPYLHAPHGMGKAFPELKSVSFLGNFGVGFCFVTWWFETVLKSASVNFSRCVLSGFSNL